MEINLKDVEINTVRAIPKAKALKNKVLPYKICNNEIHVLTTTEDKSVIDEISFIYGKNTVIHNINENELIKLINIFYLGVEENAEDKIIEDAIEDKNSDIHFEPNENSVCIRVRRDGVLRLVKVLAKNDYLKIISKIKIKCNLDITEKRKPQDGKFTYKYLGRNFDLRVSITNTVFGEKIVIRILYGYAFNFNLENLNFLPNQKAKLLRIIKMKTGLVIFNGPTGSGKSSTLYTILQEINNEEINITTLEDPVEVVIKGITQINLNRSINLGFAEGLRSILRQDPDVIMVGEIRDDETAKMAVRASITGHKVYSTIHTKDPREVFFRLEDMGVKGYLLRDSLVGIISQRLVRVLCKNCKESIGIRKLKGKKFEAFNKSGCVECDYSGYKGRALVASVHYIDVNVKRSLDNLYNDSTILTNDEMLFSIRRLLFSGDISIKDYIDFVQMEDIGGEANEIII